MPFFYPNGNKKKQKSGVKKRTIDTSVIQNLGCKACPLNKVDSCNPKMWGSGSKNPYIYVLGRNPLSIDDKNKSHFLGEGGMLFRELLPNSVKQKVRYNTLINCYPKRREAPKWVEIEACRKRVVEDIEKSKPTIIFGMGQDVLTWFLGEGVSEWDWRRGYMPVTVGTHTCWYFYLNDPEQVVFKATNYKGEYKHKSSKQIAQTNYGRTYSHEINNALKLVNQLPEPVVIKDFDDDIECYAGKSGDLDKIKKAFKDFKKEKTVSVDIETNGLRPYKSNAKILTTSFTNHDASRTVAFGIDHRECLWTDKDKQELYKVILEFLSDPDIDFVAHNALFEIEWFYNYFKQDLRIVDNPTWQDTQAQAYILGFNFSAQSLDNCVLRAFGFNLKKLAKTDVTNLANENINDVLFYNARDTKFTSLLYAFQKNLMSREDMPVYLEQVRRIKTIALTQSVGIQTDQSTIALNMDKLNVKRGDTLNKLKATDEIIRFMQDMGTYDPASTNDNQKLFSDYIHIKDAERTKTNKIKLNETILNSLDHPIAKLIVEYRKTEKLLSTYVTPVLAPNGANVYPDNKVHPNYTTTLTTTRRLSCNNPNCFPKGVEVLTKHGWKDFSTVTQLDFLAQYNKESGVVTFSKPISIIKQKHKGDLIHITTKDFIDIISTPDHNFYLTNRKTGKLKKVNAVGYPTEYQQPQAGMYKGGDGILRESQVALICALQADGCIKGAGKPHIAWGFRKKRKINRLLWALDAEGLSYKITKNEKGARVRLYNVPEWLKGKKQFGPWLLDMNRETLDYFTKEVFNWDGLNTRKSEYSNNDKISVDWVQILFTLSNRRANYRQSITSAGNVHNYCCLGTNSYSLTTNLNKEYVTYSGYVYCAEMPLGTLIVRHNNKVAVVGNCQNIPKRGPGKWVRNQYIPYHDWLVAIDYGQIEARVLAMASQDNAFMDALYNDYDIHMVWAEHIDEVYNKTIDDKIERGLDSEAAFKEFRSEIKNQFVFPLFYGAAHESVAQYLGIPFDIIDNVCDEFWEEFKGVKRWQKRMLDSYYDNGYVKSLTGYKRYGPLTRNEVINSPIQTTASDIVVDAMNRISEYARDTDNLALQPIMNIHDDLTFDLPDHNFVDNLDTAIDLMLDVPFDFVNVPITIEVERSNKNWYEMEVVGEFSSHD